MLEENRKAEHKLAKQLLQNLKKAFNRLQEDYNKRKQL